jgi:hypothetical protein
MLTDRHDKANSTGIELCPTMDTLSTQVLWSKVEYNDMPSKSNDYYNLQIIARLKQYFYLYDRVCFLCLELYEHENCSNLKVTLSVISLKLKFSLVLYLNQYTARKYMNFQKFNYNQHEVPYAF